MRVITNQYGCRAKVLTHMVHVVHGDYPAVKRAVENVKAIWDTGADRTSLDIDIIMGLRLRRLYLPPVYINTGNGVTKSYAFEATLDLADDWEPFKFTVWSMPPSGSVQMLIGMDIITLGRFEVCSTIPGDRTVMRFTTERL